MKIKEIAMITLVSCAVGLLTGCGVPKEEHEAKITELNTAWQEIESLTVKNTDLETLLTEEKAKCRVAQIEMGDVEEKLKKSKANEAATASALADEKSKVSGLKKEVSSAKDATRLAQEKTTKVKEKLSAQENEYKMLQDRFEQYERNMKAMEMARKAKAKPVPVKGPASLMPKPSTEKESMRDAEASINLLNQMLMQ